MKILEINLGVAETDDKTREHHLRSFGHLYGIKKQAGMGKSNGVQATTKRNRGETRETCLETIRNDLKCVT